MVTSKTVKQIVTILFLFLVACTSVDKTDSTQPDEKGLVAFDSLVTIDINKAKQKAAVALDEAKSNNNVRQLLKALYYNTRVAIQIGDSKDFMQYGEQTLRIADSLQANYYKNKVYILLGRYYIQQNDYTKALEYYIDAENYFDSIKDNDHLSSIYNGMGILYFDLKEYEKSQEYFEKTFGIYEQINNKRGTGVYYANIGNIYNITHQYNKALEYQTKSLNVFTELKDTTGMVSAYINLSNIEANLGNAIKAEEELNKAIDLSDSGDDNYRFKERILLNYAILYVGQNKLDLADKVLKEHTVLADSLKNYSGKLDALDLRISIAEARKNYKAETLYTTQFYHLKDSLYGAQVKQNIEELKWQNEFDKSRLESALLKSKYQIEKDRGAYLTYTIVLVIILSILIIGLVWVLYKNIKNNLKISKISNEKLQEQVKAEQLIIENERAENEILKLRAAQQTSELDAKNREITTINLQLLAKNKIMGDISKILDRKNKSVTAIEKDLKSIIFQNQNQEKEWEQFKEVFEKIHPGFFDKIKQDYPKLSATDLRICAYIKIRMSLNETANLLNITLQSLHTARYRLRKKLNL